LGILPSSLQHTINQFPSAIQEIVRLVVSYFEQRLSTQAQRTQELEDQLEKNSQNSSKPPFGWIARGKMSSIFNRLNSYKITIVESS
jgi:hypothetical protein